MSEVTYLHWEKVFLYRMQFDIVNDAIEKGKHAVEQEKNHEALNHFKVALVGLVWKEEGNTEKKLYLLQQISHVAVSLFRFDESARCLHTAFELNQSFGHGMDQEKRVKVFLGISSGFLKLQEFDSAIKAAQYGLQVFNALFCQDHILKVHLMQDLADAYHGTNNYYKARHQYRLSLHMSRRLQNARYSEIISLLGLGLCAAPLQEIQRGHDHYSEAYEMGMEYYRDENHPLVLQASIGKENTKQFALKHSPPRQGYWRKKDFYISRQPLQ